MLCITKWNIESHTDIHRLRGSRSEKKPLVWVTNSGEPVPPPLAHQPPPNNDHPPGLGLLVALKIGLFLAPTRTTTPWLGWEARTAPPPHGLGFFLNPVGGQRGGTKNINYLSHYLSHFEPATIHSNIQTVRHQYELHLHENVQTVCEMYK